MDHDRRTRLYLKILKGTGEKKQFGGQRTQGTRQERTEFGSKIIRFWTPSECADFYKNKVEVPPNYQCQYLKIRPLLKMSL